MTFQFLISHFWGIFPQGASGEMADTPDLGFQFLRFQGVSVRHRENVISLVNSGNNGFLRVFQSAGQSVAKSVANESGWFLCRFVSPVGGRSGVPLAYHRKGRAWAKGVRRRANS